MRRAWRIIPDFSGACAELMDWEKSCHPTFSEATLAGRQPIGKGVVVAKVGSAR